MISAFVHPYFTHCHSSQVSAKYNLSMKLGVYLLLISDMQTADYDNK